MSFTVVSCIYLQHAKKENEIKKKKKSGNSDHKFRILAGLLDVLGHEAEFLCNKEVDQHIKILFSHNSYASKRMYSSCNIFARVYIY